MIALRSPYSPFLLNRLGRLDTIEAKLEYDERWGLVAKTERESHFLERDPLGVLGTCGVIRWVDRHVYFVTHEEHATLVAEAEARNQAAEAAERREIAEAVAKAAEEAARCTSHDAISALRNAYYNAYRRRFYSDGTPARYAAFQCVAERYLEIGAAIMTRFPYKHRVFTASHPRIGVNDYETGADHIVLDEPITRGRLKRNAGDALCRGPKDGFFDTEQGSPTCARCLRIAERLAQSDPRKSPQLDTNAESSVCPY